MADVKVVLALITEIKVIVVQNADMDSFGYLTYITQLSL